MQTNVFESDAPYNKMLKNYQSAADMILHRRDKLRAELRQMRRKRTGSPLAAKDEAMLEMRISLLWDEYEEVVDNIRSIRHYADREVS